jgi:hypothetical protein
LEIQIILTPESVETQELAFDLTDAITSYLTESWGLCPSEFFIKINS